MENESGKFEFLDTEESREHFANCDFALRSGRHIQNHHHEYALFEYIEENIEHLEYYYSTLYGVALRHGEFQDNLYYFIDFDGESKGKLSGLRSEKLSSRHTLFALLLLKVYRLDNYFGSNTFAIQALKESLKNDSNAYREDIYRLFAKVSNKNNASEPDESNIDQWVDNSLAKFSDLGWIYFEPENQFTILPSFNRMFELYRNEILGIEAIMEDTKNNSVAE